VLVDDEIWRLHHGSTLSLTRRGYVVVLEPAEHLRQLTAARRPGARRGERLRRAMRRRRWRARRPLKPLAN
jgi:hypothetical protein